MNNKFDWLNFEKKGSELLIMNESRGVFDVEYNKKKKSCFQASVNLFVGIPILVLSGFTEKAKECARLGLIYVEYSREIRDRLDLGKLLDSDHAVYSMAYEQYYFEWFLSGNENLEVLCTALEKMQSIAEKYKNKKRYKEHKSSILQLVNISIKLNKMKMAQSYINELIGKTKLKMHENVIYYENFFLSSIIEYLASDVKSKELLKKLEYSFDDFFCELSNGNKKIINNYSSLFQISEISYMYYKYFHSITEDNLDPIKIIQSVRYGRIGV